MQDILLVLAVQAQECLSLSGVLVLVEPVSTVNGGDQHLAPPKTERCSNCSGSGKGRHLGFWFPYLFNECQELLSNDILFNSGHPNFDDLEDIVKTRIAFWAKNNLPGVQYGVHDFVHSPVAGCVVPLLWSCYGKPSAGVFAVMNCCCWSYSCWFSFANVCGVEMLSLMFAGLTRCYSCCFATLGAVGAAVYWCCLLLPRVLNTGASSCGKEFDGVLFGSCWKILRGKEVAELDGCPCGVNSKKAEKRIRKEREAIIATTMDDLQDIGMAALTPVFLFFLFLSANSDESSKLDSSCFSAIPISNSVAALYVFGDSTVDAGNNNYIDNAARANFLPYGIDFNNTPTGRFTNGKTIADFIAILYNLSLPPPYLSLMEAQRKTTMGGINYASAGCGISPNTKPNEIEVFNRTVQEDLPCMIEDPQELAEYLANSIFFISVGGNDYILNFNNHSDPEYFANSLLIQFRWCLQKSSGEQHRSSGMLAVDDKQDRKWAVR
ncbi:hypothetical protein TEA_010003 [Camellia sinensis var. sinensis]|uniref:GDSL esterase/lipase n=1 Tax=Camellia sinensis var. sinensis TaxID=542762 RepID=A0A4S4EYY7_CAMSN|nr:hypothetical protein TEA_010003 [Camellia sinensis var. sinensis]